MKIKNKFNFKKILVTGGAGFLGSSLINFISENFKYEKIISIDNYSSGTKKITSRKKI